MVCTANTGSWDMIPFTRRLYQQKIHVQESWLQNLQWKETETKIATLSIQTGQKKIVRPDGSEVKKRHNCMSMTVARWMFYEIWVHDRSCSCLFVAFVARYTMFQKGHVPKAWLMNQLLELQEVCKWTIYMTLCCCTLLHCNHYNMCICSVCV